MAERGNSEWRVIICDVVATALRRRSDIAPTSLRHSAATSLRRRSDIAATALRHRSDVAATNARRISEIAETTSWRHYTVRPTDTAINALQKRMRTRKPRPFFIGRRRTAEPLTCTKSARLVYT